MAVAKVKLGQGNMNETSSTRSLLPAEGVALLLSCGQTRQALALAMNGLALDSKDVDLWNLAGVCAASLGEHVQAESFWRQAIASDPNAAQAHYNLGLLQANSHREAEAEQSYRQAIALEPDNPEAHNNLGLLLARREQKGEAESCYRRAIALDPENGGVYSNLGVLMASDNRQDEAERCYRQAIALEPGDGDVHSNLGVLLASQGRNEEAEQCYRIAIALDPGKAGAAGAYSNLGILLASQGRFDEAEQCYRQAIALKPENAKAHTNLGLLLEEAKREDEAEKCHRKALALDPEGAEIHSNLANLLANHLRWDEAEECYRQAIRLKPDAAVLHSNLGVLLANRKREAEAEQCLRQAIALDPGYQLARLNLGFLLLRQARFAEGWAHHEARYDPGLPDNGIPSPKVSFPKWQGESLAGKSLLVWAEQGFGDEIQFCRYLPLLKEQGATHITLVCKTPLKSLMETLEGVDAVLAAESAAGAIPLHDYWTFPLSIPLHCQTRLETIPARLPYLRALPERIEKWSPRLPHGQFNVGLAWQGNVGHHNDLFRSLPTSSTLAPLWSVPGVRFFSLQKDSGEDEASAADQNFPEGRAPANLGSDISDFSDTAAIIEHLDLVICVDTAVAHLAGALAKPCWVLLPAYRTDWRWLHERPDSPWYPGVMRLFRQKDGQDWTSVIADVRKALNDEVLGKMG